jgi:hypothetical protein
MPTLEHRLEQVAALRAALAQNKDLLICWASPAEPVYNALIGQPYCHPVPSFQFGVFGTISVNQPRSESWVGAFVSKPVGGYGYSGWIWEPQGDTLLLKQGPKLLSLETSREPD